MKTINANTAIANKIIIIKIGDMAPVLPCSNICAKALGNSATMPNMINETPLPSPRSVICSPNHNKNITPPTKVTTVVV